MKGDTACRHVVDLRYSISHKTIQINKYHHSTKLYWKKVMSLLPSVNGMYVIMPTTTNE